MINSFAQLKQLISAEKVEIEIKLQRGVYAEDVVQSLYAFTDCEQSISCNLLVIKDNMPQVMTITEVIRHHSNQAHRVVASNVFALAALRNDSTPTLSICFL